MDAREQSEPLVSIYVLIDPRHGDIRYVGQTTQHPVVRMCQHIADSRIDKNDKKTKWLMDLVENNLLPEVKVVDTVLLKDSYSKELEWINKYRADGVEIFNSYIAVDFRKSPSQQSMSDIVYEWLNRMSGEFQWQSEEDVPSAREIVRELASQGYNIAPSSAQRGRKRWLKGTEL